MDQGSFRERLRNALDLLLDALDGTERELSEAERAAVIGAVLPSVLHGADARRTIISTSQPSSPESPETLIKAVGATTFSDQALALAWYSLHVKGDGTFTSSDMGEMFKECRVPLPANMSDVLAKLEKQRVLTGVGSLEGGLKQYVVSQDGDDLIEGRLKKNQEPPTE
ncbi:MAG: hypothetical protein KAW89_07925 [Armatimonadetes bacterium]|nr:hypothetical protein [Armatimonadota bacterium]